MASTSNSGILPSYQRFVNGVPVPSIRRSFRSREKCLIVLVLLTFGGVCFGAFFYLPEYGKGNNSNSGNDINNVLVGTSVYNRVYQHVQKAGEDLLIPAPPLGDAKVHRHGDLEDVDPHVAEDKAKLLARIEEDSVKTKVLERPQTYVQDALSGRQSTSSASRLEESMKSLANLQPPSNMDANFQELGEAEKSLEVITVPPERSDRLPIIQGGADDDDLTRVRRDKVKESRIEVV